MRKISCNLCKEFFCGGTCPAAEVTSCSLSERITWSRAADLFDSSLLQLSAAAWQQSFSLVAKTVKFIPSHSSNCHRGETESRLSHLWELAAHDNDPAHISSWASITRLFKAALMMEYWCFHDRRCSTLQHLCVRIEFSFFVWLRRFLLFHHCDQQVLDIWLKFSHSPQAECKLLNKNSKPPSGGL